MSLLIKVDVIIAVYNAESTIEETVRTAMHQVIPHHLLQNKEILPKIEEGEVDFCMNDLQFDIMVCCYNDASNDKSLDILYRLESEFSSCPKPSDTTTLSTKLIIGTAQHGMSRGAGYARNQAAKLRAKHEHTEALKDKHLRHFLCILDSDDLMHPTRIAEQTYAMLSLDYDKDGNHLCKKTIMGCQFDRIPNNSTWHYQNWANSLSNDRLYLEKFRECTLIQPTWFIDKDWFDSLGGYLEGPDDHNINHGVKRKLDEPPSKRTRHYQLIHPSEFIQSKEPTNTNSLRLAEDLRFFYSHLRAGGTLHLHRTPLPLVSYRHRLGMSQSSSTPRKLLLKLRAKAWEDLIYYGGENKLSSSRSTIWSKLGFVIWGAGRDGKDFLKSLSPEVASSAVCFVDVDEKKINQIKFYDNPNCKRIPILHFSVLRARSNSNDTFQDSDVFGRIDKRKENVMAHLQLGDTNSNHAKDQATTSTNTYQQKQKVNFDHGNSPLSEDKMAMLPVVVCVAMYRSNGALEKNVASIGRIEGESLWHFC